MDNPLFIQLSELIRQWSPWYAVATARPAGFALMFAVFAWGKLNMGVMRMAFAIALSLPIFSGGIESGSIKNLDLPVAAIVAKEIFLGGALGFFASLPLAIAIAAGGIVDFYRGAFQGAPDPAGGQLTAVSTLFAVLALWVFANLGGFWIVASIIYSSYGIWPIQTALPTLVNGSDALLQVIENLAYGALVLAGPLILILFVSDIVHLVSSKFGKQINVTHMAFSSKNLILAALLPVFCVIAVRALKADFSMLEQSIDWMRIAFQ